LEDVGCVSLTLVGIIIILLLYADDIVFMGMSPYDLSEQLRILNDFCFSTCMIVNTDIMKVMITKSKNITYDVFVYENNSLEEVPSYKYLEILIFITTLIGIIALRK
jgi:hypothetical protein